MSSNIVEITQENAQQVLIDGSHQQLVMVDFWADWCAPCKSLMPVLEKLAGEYQDQLVLAKVNADEQQMLAAQFGVRSLPTVMLLKDGQPVDGFMGAQPESAVREMLEKYLPNAWDLALAQARTLMAETQFGTALPLLKQALEDSGQQADIALAYAECLLELNRCEEAQAVLDTIKLADQDAQYQQLKAQLTLKQEASRSPEVEALEQQFKEDPENLELAYQLGVQYSQNGHQREALETLLAILRKNIGFKDGAARTAYMDILATLGKGDPLAVEYQRKVYTLLY
ncbi:thioredoxin [Exilibacterium tricleocarpae]|uniref:Thioredoxin n=1 Tax=Exilibacterium tricleocarpae TaxID=2591008 RepID=A0A545SMU7_9GAMM|nr:thioredoxin [Exilibacterium tricleocarpae]TQV66289.1 thioredoxin [Exilibacterium tricleocarpae]